MKETIIQQGAEAIISLKDNQILKHRIKKSYRIPEIDLKLRKSRTKSEAKIINKLQNIIPIPKILKTDEKTFEIFLEYIDGKKLSDNLETLDYEQICKKIAENIAKLHDENIIHGDLTTSNMIYVENTNKVYFIDFGLGFHSSRIEDKAVDLHLLKQALEAKHFKIYKKAFEIILQAYNPKDKAKILEQFKKVEARGRYKH